jgi:hypothetical protein
MEPTSNQTAGQGTLTSPLLTCIGENSNGLEKLGEDISNLEARLAPILNSHPRLSDAPAEAKAEKAQVSMHVSQLLHQHEAILSLQSRINTLLQDLEV